MRLKDREREIRWPNLHIPLSILHLLGHFSSTKQRPLVSSIRFDTWILSFHKHVHSSKIAKLRSAPWTKAILKRNGHNPQPKYSKMLHPWPLQKGRERSYTRQRAAGRSWISHSGAWYTIYFNAGNTCCCDDNRAVKISLLVLMMEMVTGDMLPFSLLEGKADGWPV